MIAPGIRVARGPNWIWDDQGKCCLFFFLLRILVEMARCDFFPAPALFFSTKTTTTKTSSNIKSHDRLNIPIKMLIVSTQKLADDGEGHIGTVCELGRAGSTYSPEKTVIVNWDSGNRSNYRVGYQDQFDLIVVDNAQIGKAESHMTLTIFLCAYIFLIT